jgi:hypothetical protein
MPERIRWIQHKGIKALLNDYRYMEGRKLLDQVDACVEHIVSSGKNDIVLLLDIEKVEVSSRSQLKFAAAAKQVKPHCKRTAIAGLDDVKRNILGIVNKVTGMNALGFKTELEAKDWLICRE